jgi:hypothetical protein
MYKQAVGIAGMTGTMQENPVKKPLLIGSTKEPDKPLEEDLILVM